MPLTFAYLDFINRDDCPPLRCIACNSGYCNNRVLSPNNMKACKKCAGIYCLKCSDPGTKFESDEFDLRKIIQKEKQCKNCKKPLIIRDLSRLEILGANNV